MDFIKETNLNGLLETLDLLSHSYKEKGINPPYLLKLPKRIWDKANKNMVFIIFYQILEEMKLWELIFSQVRELRK